MVFVELLSAEVWPFARACVRRATAVCQSLGWVLGKGSYDDVSMLLIYLLHTQFSYNHSWLMTIICFTQSFLLYRLDLLLRPSCTFVHEVCRPRREFEPLYCANALGIPVGLWGDVWWASDLSASINQVQEVTHKWPRPRFCSMLPCRFYTVLGCCLEPRVASGWGDWA